MELNFAGGDSLGNQAARDALCVEQGGDLVNPFQPNVAGAADWHELIDLETYEYRGTRETEPATLKI